MRLLNMDLRVIYILPFIFIQLILISNKEWFLQRQRGTCHNRHELHFRASAAPSEDQRRGVPWFGHFKKFYVLTVSFVSHPHSKRWDSFKWLAFQFAYTVVCIPSISLCNNSFTM